MSTCVYNAPSLLYTFLQIYGIFFYLHCAQTASTCRCPCRPMICSHFFFVYWLTQTANTLRLLQVHFTFSDAAPAPRLKTSLPSRHGLALEQPVLSWSQSAGTCTVTAVFPMFLCLLASPFYIALCCCLGDRRCTGKLGCDDCLHMCVPALRYPSVSEGLAGDWNSEYTQQRSTWWRVTMWYRGRLCKPSTEISMWLSEFPHLHYNSDPTAKASRIVTRVSINCSVVLRFWSLLLHSHKLLSVHKFFQR